MKKFICFHFILLLLLILTGSGLSAQKVVDCLAATVDREVITLLDLKIYRELIFLPAESAADPEKILEKIIEIKLVAREARKELSFGHEEMSRALDDLFKLKGEEKVRARMETYGLTLKDLESYLKEKWFYEEMLARRQTQQVNVTLKEIENYYLERYLAEKKAAREEARPLVEVIGEIERRIRQDKIKEQIALWIKGLKDRAIIKINQDCLKMLEREARWPE